ncbi:response regulator transcription factor [Miniphocaeibacter massiliensis]|uniref:response regulator transcription factor n=1 Tax=Miniphocaeibacter massiliensis TaxID=2041841 RepID=UPI000C06C114|nr:response regulator transcription factor [Miniphocaeibacter massiliensis]
MNILLVEDDKEISEMVESFLVSENFKVSCAFDGESAIKLFNSNSYDIVLLDLMIPKVSGLDVLKEIRKQSHAPVIIMSAKDSDSDVVLGLGLGADDYVTKPFSISQVLARIKATLRRSNVYSGSLKEEVSSSSLLSHGDLVMNLEDYSVLKGNVTLDLTAKEFAILRLFMENPSRVYTKEQVYSSIWEDDYLDDENALNVHISRLRTKIEDNPRSPKHIVTVWGIGYKLGKGDE